ncbi:MAG TPA: SUF system NifU family Fe-S cluster assembly protein [Gemmatimonadaceae bacterium]|jgi:nitrogen fixation NifU-like protein|nr:SUF system NifU family Fe-S cluster assembly protein [Gemmatimonadaceae bacterium]
MDLNALYQSIILDHNRRPRNYRELADADRRSEGRNPLCGDEVTVWLKMDGDRIEDASFLGSGCAISKASASIMTTAVKGKTRAEASALFDRFHDLVTGNASARPEDPALGSLAAFSGVSRFPVRVKCASLAWHAMRAALRGEGDVAITERQ